MEASCSFDPIQLFGDFFKATFMSRWVMSARLSQTERRGEATLPSHRSSLERGIRSTLFMLLSTIRTWCWKDLGGIAFHLQVLELAGLTVSTRGFRSLAFDCRQVVQLLFTGLDLPSPGLALTPGIGGMGGSS